MALSANNQKNLGQALDFLYKQNNFRGGYGGSGVAELQAPTEHPKLPTATTSSQSNISKFAHFLGGVAHGIGSVTEGAAKWVASNVAKSVEAPFKFTYDVGSSVWDLHQANQQLDQQMAERENLAQLWNEGKISGVEYQNSLRDLNHQNVEIGQQLKSVNNKLSNSKLEGVDTAATLVSLLTLGAGAKIGQSLGSSILTRDAGDFLASTAARPFFSGTIDAVKNVASQPGVFNLLNDASKKAIQSSVADVVATGTKMSAGQIARAAAVNLAFKYPLTYWYTSSTADQLYHELDQKKYGDAVRTAAFNAALLLSGGPIGYALKWGSKGTKAAVSKTFARSAFIDELSKGISRGNADGIANAVRSIVDNPAYANSFKFLDKDGNLSSLSGKEAQERVIANLSSLEHTNMGAAGNDPVAAAWRVLKGMNSYEGVSMADFSHEEALLNMNNFAEAQRIADAEGRKIGQRITVGRVDARDKAEISAVLNPAEGATPDQRLQLWEQYKVAHPNEAWANNENFDRQIKALIEKYPESGELDTAIRNIKAAFNVARFDKKLAKTLGQMGYLPITPKNLEAPFEEGTGKVTSVFGDANSDVFLKSVQPVPILSWMGDMFTKAGLSPYAAKERVYQVFNDNLAKNLKSSGAVEDITGESLNQTADSLVKQLSSYMHEPTRRGWNKVPMTDLRMMTRKDIQAATGVSVEDAKKIQKAITSSYIQVPLAMRGLGDRAVDLAYKGVTGAAQRRYLRFQGALRFGWNPFFQYLRLAPKTEILSEFEGGGFVRSVFAGRAKQLNNIRNELRQGGFLDEKAGFAYTGEAAEFAGSTGRNLSHKLLPAQEHSIAGLIDAQAQRLQMDVKDYIATYPDQVRNTIQMITEYDKRSNILNSPLLRTINIAFFPLRFETKVATIMARNLAKSSLMTQVSVVKGLMSAHTWLNTDQGRAWYANNADAIGLFKYITPLASLNEVFESLLPGHDHSLGNFGELGGLPFGWIPQLLDSEGLTHFNQPGVAPDTGKAYTQYIPSSARGQVATAIQDLISSLFSYPGATIGLPSKTKMALSLSEGITGAKSSDFDKQTPTPTAQALAYRQSLIRSGVVQPDNQPSASAPQTIPSEALGPRITANIPPPVSVPSKGSGPGGRGKKKKKAEFTPELLPGQTQLGSIPGQR